MRGKRELVARLCAATGFTRMFENIPKQRVLLIINYHRIGNAEDTPYDSGVFSCTADQLESQIAYLKKHYRIATLEEVLDIANGQAVLSEAGVLVTFDDGYIDNYQFAFPILQRHGVRGVFFLPTAFVGTGRLPWWDVIAYIIKRSRKMKIHINYPESATFDVARDGVETCVMRISNLYKQPSMNDGERFLEALESACDSPRPLGDTDRCFLSFDEAREMQRGGMTFGSHTHTHELLARMPAERQREEISISKEILQSELRTDIETLAYPVGLPHTFSEDTIRALRETGYKAAFSFYGGFNRSGTIQPFDIRRVSVARPSKSRFRLQTSLGLLTGMYWF
jgi:peptidoglycan/xylan/chitin deacetylase (PgdA/CDA1 family)